MLYYPAQYYLLVPDLDTVHCGRRCDRASVDNTHACMFFKTRMHDISDMETVTRMRGLHDGEIRFTLMNIVFKQSKQIKGTVYSC